jgi:hypothetical protein
MYTALDFDSNGSLGSISAIEDYATCMVTEMGHRAQLTRSIKPTVKISTQQTSSNVNSTVARAWQDSGAAGTPHYCIRSIFSTTATTYGIVATTTIWFAFRNQI